MAAMSSKGVETAGRMAIWSPAKRLRAPNEAIRVATRSTYTTDPAPDSAELSTSLARMSMHELEYSLATF
jgi:hypothetical protein